MAALKHIAARLAEGGKGRTEAEIQADVRSLLLEAPLYLEDEDLQVFLEHKHRAAESMSKLVAQSSR